MLHLSNFFGYQPIDLNKRALTDGRYSLSFEELSHMSDILSSILIETYKIKIGDRIVIFTDKSIELVILTMAIWKSGGIYVPVDKNNGELRTDNIIKNIAPSLIVSSDKYLSDFNGIINNIPSLSYEKIRLFLKKTGTSILKRSVNFSENDIAVIIHTSGSTGNPKGVCLSHKSIINYFYGENELLNFNTKSNTINFGPFHFDVSIQDTFLPLFFGAEVYIYDSFLIPDIIANIIIENDISHLICISSVFNLITGTPKQMKLLSSSKLECCMVGGEIIDNKLINFWLNNLPNLKYYYGYGPTECNSLCMAYQITTIDENRIMQYPIGKPFTGSKALLLDAGNNILKNNNVIGKLVIGGIQLMEGYWNLPKESTDAFIIIDNEKYYITGDLAQRDDNGNYIFEGRTDREVKINGRRINLNEIRDCILKLPDVEYVIVDVITIDNNLEIYSYIYNTKKTLSKEKIMQHTIYALPPYMTPKHIFISDEIFKTNSNKISEKETKTFLLKKYFNYE
jgi:D-alanine--poly(phosphoribitol) ligase subunit 1